MFMVLRVAPPIRGAVVFQAAPSAVANCCRTGTRRADVARSSGSFVDVSRATLSNGSLDACFVARYVTIALKAMFLAAAGGLRRYPDVREQTWGEGWRGRADDPRPIRQGVRT